MVSSRCKMAVQAELDKLGLHPVRVDLGEIEIEENIGEKQQEELKEALLKIGLELLLDQKTILVEKIKNTIVQLVHFTDELPKILLSKHMSEYLHHDYAHLANLFSEETGNTIEHFLIAQKIERVKEMLIYEDLHLTEIAYRMNYSSVAHLSNQFRKVTGLTPTFFKKLKNKSLSTIGNV